MAITIEDLQKIGFNITDVKYEFLTKKIPNKLSGLAEDSEEFKKFKKSLPTKIYIGNYLLCVLTHYFDLESMQYTCRVPAHITMQLSNKHVPIEWELGKSYIKDHGINYNTFLQYKNINNSYLFRIEGYGAWTFDEDSTVNDFIKKLIDAYEYIDESSKNHLKHVEDAYNEIKTGYMQCKKEYNATHKLNEAAIASLNKLIKE